MKKQLYILIFFALLSMAGIVHADLFSGPSINATLLYYQPVPASPGSSLDVFVQLNNDGETAKNVIVTFVDNTPFTLDSEADRVKSITAIPGQNSFLLKYRVQVSQDAAPGTSFVKLQYSIGVGGNPQTVLLPIDIFSTTVALNVEGIQLTPEDLVPGGVGKLSFELHNDAPVKIRDGTVTIDLGNLDIAPVGSTNQQRFTDLRAGEIRQFSFTLAPSPNMAPGVYKIPVLVNFSDQNGRGYQRSEYVGIRVGAKPDVSITIDDTTLTSAQKTGDLIIRVTNKGLGEIKFADVTLAQSDSYELISGSNERYVGNIDSDDYKTARVTITATGDTVSVPVTLTYMDALNTQYNMSQTLTIKVRSAKNGSSNWLIISIVVLVLVIGGYFFFKRRKSR